MHGLAGQQDQDGYADIAALCTSTGASPSMVGHAVHVASSDFATVMTTVAICHEYGTTKIWAEPYRNQSRFPLATRETAQSWPVS